MKSLAMLCVLFTITLCGQTATPQVLRANATLIFVPTEVRTHTGDLVYGLTAAQFRLEDNGISQAVSLDDSDTPQNLALAVVVQCSRDAYRDAAHVKGLATMIESLVGQAPHSVAVVSFGDEAHLIQGFTDDDAKLSASLSTLAPCREQSNDVILDAVMYASHLLQDKSFKESRRVVLLISETRDHGSQTSSSDVVAELGRSNIAVESISYGPAKSQLVYELTDPSRNVVMHGQANWMPLLVMSREAIRQNVPHTLSQLTGGQYVNFTTAKGFDKSFSAFTNQLHNEYRLSFQPASPVGPGMHRLTVSVPSMPDAIVQSRLTYFSGPPSQVNDPR